MGHRSEVARILDKIREEYDAATQGLNGLAEGVCRHSFITTRMENMGELNAALQGLVGKEQAMHLTISLMNDSCGDTAAP